MHIESDTATRENTLARYTGHSVRYIRVRSAVRAAGMLALSAVLFGHVATHI